MSIRNIALIICVLLSLQTEAQDVLVYPLNDLNTDNDEIPCDADGNIFYYISGAGKDLLMDIDWYLPTPFKLFSVTRTTRFVELDRNKKFEVDLGTDCEIGTGKFIPGEKEYCFSRTCFRDGREGLYRLEIGNLPLSGNRTKEVSKAIDSLHAVHPCFSEDGNQMIFASLDPNSKDEVNMDLFICSRNNKDKWSTPVRLSEAVNSSADEVFPFLYKGDLIFSSDREGGMGGLDFYKASKESQWRDVIPLKEPFNSSFDDFAIIYLNNEKGFFSSNREGGKGGDDIYFFEKLYPQRYSIDSLRAQLTLGETGIKDARILLYDDLGDRILEATTDENGDFYIPPLQEGKKFKLKVDAGNPRMLKDCIIRFYNEKGEVFQLIQPNREGEFIFEMLPYDAAPPVDLMANFDESSLLGIDLEGQLFAEKPGDVGEGERVYLIDEEGDAERLTYTEDEGIFRFDNVPPQSEYELRLDPENEDLKMLIKDAGKVDTLSFREATVLYQRLEEGEYRKIELENGEHWEVRLGEPLKINQIEYEFDKYDLNAEARQRLTALLKILLRNPGMDLELHSHTDCRGSDQYNVELSEKRAKGAEDFMVDNGLPRNRIKSIGLGEYELLNHCDDEVECEEDDHARNRRTELIILAR